MILVTGATGTIGSVVLRILLERGEKARGMTRQPSSGDHVFGDFEDPAALAAAVSGAETVFMLTAPGKPTPAHDLALLGAAGSAGVRKVVKLSATGTDEPGFEAVGSWHVPGERAIRGSGLAWTLLRPTTFASNSLAWAEYVRAGQPIPTMTGDGLQGVVDPRDIAAVAVETLLSAEHDGQVYTLTGPELITVPEQAELIGRALGRAVQVADLLPEVGGEQMRAAGMDEQVVDVMVKGTTFVRAGGNAVLTDHVQEVTGRPATSYASWLADHIHAFR